MSKLNFEDWAGRPPTKLERQLVDAAIAMNVTTAASCAFVELVRSSEVQKGSAYRACPAGMVGVVELLQSDTVRVIFTKAFEALAELRDQPDGADANFATVVETGINAVLCALSDARWTGEVLWQDRNAITSYLLRRGEGDIYSRLVGFATWCASNRGAPPAAARKGAEALVWEVLTAAVAALSPHPGERPQWPVEVGEKLRKLVGRFADDLNLAEELPPPFFPGDLFTDHPGTLVAVP